MGIATQQFEYLEWESRLVSLLDAGVPVFWRSDSGMQRVVEIGSCPGEPGPCAFLEGNTGRYVAMDNCEQEDFAAMTEV